MSRLAASVITLLIAAATFEVLPCALELGDSTERGRRGGRAGSLLANRTWHMNLQMELTDLMKRRKATSIECSSTGPKASVPRC
jgi:hypothetical protein